MLTWGVIRMFLFNERLALNEVVKMKLVVNEAINFDERKNLVYYYALVYIIVFCSENFS